MRGGQRGLVQPEHGGRTLETFWMFRSENIFNMMKTEVSEVFLLLIMAVIMGKTINTSSKSITTFMEVGFTYIRLL